MSRERSAAMVKALRLILVRGLSAAEAAKITGITKGAISQTPEYRAHRAALAEQKQDAKP